MDFKVAVFTVGAGLALLGLFGAGGTILGIKVPTLSTGGRIVGGVLGLVLVLTSGALWAVESIHDDVAQPSPVAAPPAPPGQGDVTAAPPAASASPGEHRIVEVHRSMLLRHREERLEISVDQNPPVTLVIDREAPSGSLELAVAGEGPHRFEAVLSAIDDAGDEFVFSGTGVLEARSLRVVLDRGSATVVLEPQP